MSKQVFTLRIPGESQTDSIGERLAPEGFDLLQAEVVDAYELTASRAAEAQFTERILGEDEIVQLELEGNVTLYLTRESWLEIIAGPEPRDGGDDSFTVPLHLPLGSNQRGGFKNFFVKALKFLKILPSSDDVAALATHELTEKLEGQLIEGGGLLQCSLDDFALHPPGADIPADRPILLFIHGTASSTEGSFGDLWSGEQQHVWRQHVEEAYGEHVYAFEHRSLSQGPIDNALELVDKLPHGARLHLVSHSRGGLVAELLCRGDVDDGTAPFTDAELALFETQRPDQAEQLRQLAALLSHKDIRVERFVRVACPARGTTLASKRLDIYFSVLLNALKLIPALRTSPTYNFVESVLLAILKQRTDPEELPGLEAMMPESPFIRLTNSRLTTSNADLSVIAGDIEAQGLFQSLAVLVTNLFYLQKHDLVVNTSAMSGGMPRKDGVRQSFHQGGEVSHFRYFANADSVQKLISGLSRTEGSNAGFTPLLEATREIPARSIARRGGEGGPICFVLPGVFGSHLEVGRHLIWIDLFNLALGRMNKLRIHRDANPVSLHASTYGDIVDTLSRTHTVIPFAYDWRQSLQDSADRLAEAIREQMAQHPQTTIRLLAHSMGGLLARTMIARHPELWAKMGERDGSHLLMLGTPNHGSWAIPSLFLGHERLSRMLAAIDLKNSHEELLTLLTGFPGLLEMLPEDGDLDLFKASSWRQLPLPGGWPRPAADDLNRARRSRELLHDQAIDPERMFLVLGQQDTTPAGLDISDGDILLRQTTGGDGRVTWASARLPDIETWYCRINHGDLPRDDGADQQAAIVEILTTGFTSRLERQPPTATVSRAPSRGIETLDLYPDDNDLARAAFLGVAPPPQPRDTLPLLQASVTYGDLRYARHPIMAGHYENDVIVSAERVLDRSLDNRLSQSRELGLYPGAANTASVFLRDQPNSDARLFGAIIIGLGQLGSLSPAQLQSSMRHGVLTYIRYLHDNGFASDQPLGISCLLVGSGSGGISMEDALTALLRGAQDANKALVAQKGFTPLRLQSIEFVELFLDRAVQAARVLQGLCHNIEFRNGISLTPGIRETSGGRERIVWSEGDDWWERLRISQGERGELNFVYLTQRARAEARLVQTQRQLIDRFIERATTTTRNDADVATTLFELLVPTEFKHQAPQRDDTLLILDRTAARYPWELLQQRSMNGAARPIAVQAGLIRQLVVSRFRRNPAPPDLHEALVIGDPKSDFTELPGAQQEADQVRTLLTRHDYNTSRSLLRSNAEHIIAALYARPYRILHLAGHGVYDYQDPANAAGELVSGMVLGNGMFLTAAEISQMPAMPDLVFINCCHLGRDRAPEDGFETGLRPNLLAASLATQLIEEGARCVIAAGWAVDDRAALRFAEVFYQRMVVDNASFGSAVLDARRAVYRDLPDSNTWGAYQCYGDPNFRLRTTATDSGRSHMGPEFTIPREMTLYLKDLRQRASSAASEDMDFLRNELRRLLRQAPPEWHGDSALLSTTALAWGELGDYEESIHYHRRALTTDQQDLSLKALEHYANMLVRLAGQRYEMRGRLEPEDERLLHEAIERLEQLARLAPTSERYALLGSAWKRRALTAGNSDERSAAIDQVSRWYHEAHQLYFDRHGEADPYPLLNWLLATIVRGWRGRRDELPEFTTWLDEADKVLHRQCQESPDFWCAIGQIESRLTRYLAADASASDGGHELAAHVDELSEAFATTCRRYGSVREHRSSIETLRFLLAMTQRRRSRAAVEARRNLQVLVDRWQGVPDAVDSGQA